MKHWTAAQLADALDGMRHYSHNTGSPSMLEEATLAFARKHSEIAGPHQAFGEARYAHMRSYITSTDTYSQETRDRMLAAAEALAAALRPLGEARIARCKQITGWGTCDVPLSEDGTCPALRHHADAPEEGRPDA